jgi:hypothetical protein
MAGIGRSVRNYSKQIGLNEPHFRFFLFICRHKPSAIDHDPLASADAFVGAREMRRHLGVAWPAQA